MAEVAYEVCANCGGKIGRLESPHLWNGEVVCGDCSRKLGEAARPAVAASAVPYASPASARAGVSGKAEYWELVAMAGVLRAVAFLYYVLAGLGVFGVAVLAFTTGSRVGVGDVVAGVGIAAGLIVAGLVFHAGSAILRALRDIAISTRTMAAAS